MQEFGHWFSGAWALARWNADWVYTATAVALALAAAAYLCTAPLLPPVLGL